MNIPLDDGVTHINIYSKAETELGLMLSNFYCSPFVHPVWGEFQSIEGFWYWLGTGKKHDTLRVLSGYHAKRYGKELDVVQIKSFNEHIKITMSLKLLYNPHIRKMLIESVLPFDHYYYYGDKSNPKIHRSNEYNWITEEWEKLRVNLKKHTV